MTVTTKFYSLLFVDQENINPNLRPSVDSLDVYVSCAGLCAKTFAAIKAPYSVITNNASLLRERFDRLAAKKENADRLFSPQKGNAEECPIAGSFLHIGIRVFRIGQDVGNLNSRAGQ